MIRRVLGGSIGVPTFCDSKSGKRQRANQPPVSDDPDSYRERGRHWRRHYVFIRVTYLQLFVGNTIHLTIRPAVLYAVLGTGISNYFRAMNSFAVRTGIFEFLKSFLFLVIIISIWFSIAE